MMNSCQDIQVSPGLRNGKHCQDELRPAGCLPCTTANFTMKWKRSSDDEQDNNNNKNYLLRIYPGNERYRSFYGCLTPDHNKTLTIPFGDKPTTGKEYIRIDVTKDRACRKRIRHSRYSCKYAMSIIGCFNQKIKDVTETESPMSRVTNVDVGTIPGSKSTPGLKSTPGPEFNPGANAVYIYIAIGMSLFAIIVGLVIGIFLRRIFKKMKEKPRKTYEVNIISPRKDGLFKKIQGELEKGVNRCYSEDEKLKISKKKFPQRRSKICYIILEDTEGSNEGDTQYHQRRARLGDPQLSYCHRTILVKVTDYNHEEEEADFAQIINAQMLMNQISKDEENNQDNHWTPPKKVKRQNSEEPILPQNGHSRESEFTCRSEYCFPEQIADIAKDIQMIHNESDGKDGRSRCSVSTFGGKSFRDMINNHMFHNMEHTEYMDIRIPEDEE